MSMDTMLDTMPELHIDKPNSIRRHRNSESVWAFHEYMEAPKEANHEIAYRCPLGLEPPGVINIIIIKRITLFHLKMQLLYLHHRRQGLADILDPCHPCWKG